jgi:putative peptidoglycan lipid II flippase
MSQAVPSAGPADARATSSSRLARSAGVISIATMGSRLLGLARDTVLAYFFGAGRAMDAFNVAFRIPNLLRDLFAEGAMSAAFVPTFTRYLTLRNKEEAWRLGSTVINALLLATGLLAVLGIVFAEQLVRLLAADYALVPGKFELTVSLTRVMWPFLTLVALAAACMGMLNSLRRFFIPAFSPAMFNIGTILCVVVLVPIFRSLGVSLIMAVAIGTLVGGLGQIAIQWPSLRREGFRYRLVFNPRDEGLREILVLMVPAVVGLAAVQVNVLVNTMLASRGGHDGPVTWLLYAFRLMYMPIGLFGVSIATAALPSISRHAAREDTSAMRGTLSSGIRMMLMFNVPATAGLIALASPIVALLFERGRFTPADTAATAAAVVFYAPGLVGYSAVKIAVPTFYALQTSRVPVAVSVCTVLVNVVLNLILFDVMGYRGLALGTAIAALFNASVLLWILRRRLDGLDGRRLATAFVKIAIASVVMAAAAWYADVALHDLIAGERTIPRLLRLTLTIGAAVGVLALMARILRIHEFAQAVRAVTQRLVGGAPTAS